MLAVVLNVLLPGLGHAYMGRLARALIWVGGAVMLTVVLSQGTPEPPLWIGFTLGTALGVFAAIDIALLMRMEGAAR